MLRKTCLPWAYLGRGVERFRDQRIQAMLLLPGNLLVTFNDFSIEFEQ